MSITKYEAFIKTLEYTSLTKAAENLGYTQSGISHILNALENECDLKLLNRDRSGVSITSDGQELLPYFKKLYKDYLELSEKINELHGLQTGLIRLGTFSSVSTHWIPSIIKSFHSKYPNINFELIHGDYLEIENMISKGIVDCGFIQLPSRIGLETIFLKTDPIFAILPKDHDLVEMESIPIETLLQYPFIAYEKNTQGGIREMIDNYPLVKPNIKHIVEDDYTIQNMVENGLGSSIVPELVLQRSPYDVVVKELKPAVHRELGIAFKKDTRVSTATQHFLKHVEELFLANVKV